MRSFPLWGKGRHLSEKLASLIDYQICQAYVEELGKVPKSALDAAGTRIVVIGCGDWSVIERYKGMEYLILQWILCLQ
jgi:hypothetical protein